MARCTSLWIATLITALFALGRTAAHGQACDGVTPVAGEAITLELVTDSVSRPVDATSPPGDTERLFVVEHAGVIRIIDLSTDTLLPTPFLSISGLVDFGGEAGLLGLAFHPEYDQNGYFYVDYISRRNGSRETILSRFSVSEGNPDVADPASEKVLLTFGQPRSNHNGGQLAFGPLDGYLYVSTGDGGIQHDPDNNAQNPLSYLGKILRIDVDGGDPYAIPSTNPFTGGAGVLPEIWGLGLRNPWRMAFDSENGDLYIGDVGQNTWEEVNWVPGDSPGGVNFEWRAREGDNLHQEGSGTPLLLGVPTPPVIDYPHSGPAFSGISVTGGQVYRGCRMPDLHGTYFFADYGTNWVRSFRIANGEVVELADRTAALNEGIRDLGDTVDGISAFGRDGLGEIYILDLPSKIFRIVPDVTIDNPPVAAVSTNPATGATALQGGAAEITLDGSSSDNGEGSSEGLTYLWEKRAGPAGDTILSPTGASTVVQFAARGQYVYRLTVDDGAATDSAETTVVVETRFVRADANADRLLDISDPIFTLFHIFLNSPPDVDCRDALDANDDATLDISDPIHTLETLFLGLGPIPEPSVCGPDPSDDDGLDCESSTCE